MINSGSQSPMNAGMVHLSKVSAPQKPVLVTILMGVVLMLFHQIKRFLGLFVVVTLIQGCSTSGAVAKKSTGTQFKEVSKEARDAVALKTLQSEPNSAVVFARGACCQSCSIGVRTKVATLSFVDQSRFNKGIQLDAKTQLVTLALKPGERVVPIALKMAVEAAGFTPVDLYQLDGDELKSSSLR